MNQPSNSNPVQVPAIMLIVTGALNALTGLFGVAAWIFALVDPNQQRESFKDNVEKIGFYIGQSTPGVIGLLSLVASPIVIYGAVKMLKGSSLSWARASAILAMIPVASCCCLMGLPVGIWALIVLSNPATKEYFQRGGSSYTPPPPPPEYHQPI